MDRYSRGAILGTQVHLAQPIPIPPGTLEFHLHVCPPQDATSVLLDLTVQQSLVTGLYVHPKSVAGGVAHVGPVPGWQEHAAVGGVVGHVNWGQVTLLLEGRLGKNVVFGASGVVQGRQLPFCTAGTLQTYGFKSEHG